MIATVINAVLILLGSVIGLLFQQRISQRLIGALTTVLGLVPLGLAQGMGASMVQPLAVVSIGGLVYATLMTLYIVPALYDLTIRKKPRMVAKEDLEVLEA